jgi:hypothetical protein
MDSTDIPRIPGPFGAIFRLIKAHRNEIRSQSPVGSQIVALPASAAPKLVVLP